jgi:hypothetical protein
VRQEEMGERMGLIQRRPKKKLMSMRIDIQILDKLKRLSVQNKVSITVLIESALINFFMDLKEEKKNEIKPE